LDEAQQLENQRLINLKEERARKEAGHWTIGMLWRIVRGDPPPEFADYSLRRVAVLERACLILIDVARERRPSDPDVWTEGPLTQRIEKFKEAEAYRVREIKVDPTGFPTVGGRSIRHYVESLRSPIGWAELPWRER
jgi:hypothetical protein